MWYIYSEKLKTISFLIKIQKSETWQNIQLVFELRDYHCKMQDQSKAYFQQWRVNSINMKILLKYKNAVFDGKQIKESIIRVRMG